MSLENSFGAKEDNIRNTEENCNLSFENNPNSDNCEDNQNLKKQYLNFLLKATFSNLDKIFLKSLFIVKFNCFNMVREYHISKSLIKFKGCLISNTIKNILNKLLCNNREFRLRKMQRCFSKWLERTKLIIKLSKYRVELEQNVMKKFEKETKIQDQKYKEKEKEIQEIKKLISKNLELSSDLNKKIKEYEEKENKNNSVLKKLEEEKRILQDEIKINEKVYRNSESIDKLENKIKDYDSQVKILQSQINEKEYNISLFVKEMNDMLEAYEKINTEVLNQNKDIDLEGTSKSTKPTIRTINSQISNNNNSSSINNIMNVNNHSQTGLNTMRTNTNNNTSNSKGIFLNVYNSNQNSTKLSFNMNKNNLSNNSNIFKSKN